MPADLDRSAALLAGVLGAAVLPDRGPFARATTGNRVTLDYVHDARPFSEQYCAFLVDDTRFDAAHRRLLDEHIAIYADASRRQPGEINHRYGARGVYFDDPDGHLMELRTVPHGDSPEQ